jgi:hypothetical protein
MQPVKGKVKKDLQNYSLNMNVVAGYSSCQQSTNSG